MPEAYLKNYNFSGNLQRAEKNLSWSSLVKLHNSKTFKSYLVRAALPKIGSVRGSESCEKGNCQAYDPIVKTNTFTTKVCGEVFEIQNRPLSVT